ncbi:MAG: sigma-70 family RNA polymerase sigma factor [Flavobacteriales bacterium]|nr:sigma-70 family RNA polymerase sigma factor [Flavobacteriales bacterium]
MATNSNRREFRAEEVIEAFKTNDRDLTAELYRMHYPAVLKYVLQNSGDEADAKDIYQDAFIALWRNVKTDRLADKPGTNIGGYLFQIARHKWLDKLKSKQHKSMVRLAHENTEAEIDEMDSTLERESQFEALAASFEQLGDKCRSILKMYYYEKKSLEAIGVELDYDASVIRTKKYRCMMRLRKMNGESNSDN